MNEAFAASKHFIPTADIYETAKNAEQIVSIGNQTGEGWFLTGEMLELIHTDTPNIVCTQPFACLPNHVVGKGVIKELRKRHPEANIVAIDYDPGASEVNQLNRIKLMLSTAQKNLNKQIEEEDAERQVAKANVVAQHTHKRASNKKQRSDEKDMTA
jgi:predicted nucleotide-binding protein (sugar kinase/HSP70/actin superfamily)